MMMKIHTTQNLNSGKTTIPSTNNLSSKDFRLGLSNDVRNFTNGNIAFHGKPKATKDGKKIIAAAKKAVGNIKNEAMPEVKKGDKFLTSSFFNTVLGLAKYETAIAAAIAAIVCTMFRPMTIMALPGKKGKQDNAYAASHSIASGIVGLITTIILTTPFRKGSDYTQKVMLRYLKEDALKRLYPHLDLKSIVDGNGKRKPVNQWLDTSKNIFNKDFKNVDKLPEFKQFADVSKETFKDILKVDVDWLSQKGKSFNDVVTKDGKLLYDALDSSRVGIVVKDEGMGNAQILLKDLNKDYLQKIINNSKSCNNEWGKLDIESVYDKDGNVLDFRKWKDIKGNKWKLDLDTVSVSSELETANYRPRITGEKRFDDKDKEYKFVAYLKNGVDGKIGTRIDEKMALAEKRNEAHNKLLTWIPDFAFRIPIAVSTIALIPWVLKNVFKIEKSSKTNANDKANPVVQKVAKDKEEVSFKSSKDPEKPFWLFRKIGETYGKYLMESEKTAKTAEKISKMPGNTIQHVQTAGSLITSGVYVQQTLTKKELDPDRKRTLAINQVLCFFIPTAAAYTVDKSIKNWVKENEYRYAGLQEYKIAKAKAEGASEKVIKEMHKSLGERIRGVRPFASLAVFTLIYRYITPVLITPVANMIGEALQKRNKGKQAVQSNINYGMMDVAKKEQEVKHSAA